MPIETASRKVRGLLPRLLSSATRRFETDPATFFLWVLACVPLFVAPPACALLLYWFKGSQERHHSTIDTADQTHWVPVIALTNIVMSVAFWVVVGHETGEVIQTSIGSFWEWLGSFRFPSGQNPARTYQIAT